MEEFLKTRKVDPAIIKTLIDEGIDEQVLAKIEIVQLQRFLPKYGDCLALTFFAKQHCLRSTTKPSLRERLVAKFQGMKDEHGRRSTPQEGNANAKKATRKCELGWLHQYGDGLKQVRSPNGGGTRNVDADLNGTLLDILSTAKDLFFPGGDSKKGSIDDFEIFLADQTHQRLELGLTVKHVLESTHLKSARFYMVTKLKYDDDSDLPIIKKAKTVPKLAASVEVDDDDGDFGDAVADDVDILEKDQLSELPIQLVAARALKQAHSSATVFKEKEDNIPEDPVDYFNKFVFCDNQNFDLLEQALQESDIVPNTMPANIDQPTQDQENNQPLDRPYNLCLHRTVIQSEMISYFKNPEIVHQRLNVSFINELGHDADGVSRDAYAGFWDSFYQKNTDGETYRVPILVNEYSQEEWFAIGRILLKGYKDQGYFPITLAPAFSISLILGEEFLNPSILKDSFLLFLSNTEKDVIQQASTGVEFDMDELLCVLDRFQAHIIPKPDQLNSFIQQVAHRIIVQEPKYAVDSMKTVCSTELRHVLPDVTSIMKLYENLNASIPKVIKLLSATPLNKEENMALDFLKRFIRGRNLNQLNRLLRLLTGSDIICVESIDISFVVRHGTQRIPTMHTCGPSLELPSTYVSFPDFRNEWENIMDNNESIKMLIA